MTDNADTTAGESLPENSDTTPETAAARSFTQEDVNRLLAESKRKLLAEQPDLTDLRRKANAYDELELASKSELEKAQERASKLEKQAEDATNRAKDALLRSAVVAEAARKNVVDPDAAVALLDRTLLEFDGDGAPTNTAAAVDALLKAKPYLVGGGRAGSADLGARDSGGPKQIGRDALKSMTSAEIVKAQAEGRLDHLLSGSS